MNLEGMTLDGEWLWVSNADAGHPSRAVSKADAITCIDFKCVQVESSAHWDSITIGFTDAQDYDKIRLGVKLTSDSDVISSWDGSYLTKYTKQDCFQLTVQNQ